MSVTRTLESAPLYGPPSVTRQCPPRPRPGTTRPRPAPNCSKIRYRESPVTRTAAGVTLRYTARYMSRALVISVLCCCCTNCWISKCLNIYVYDPKCGVNSPDNQISRDRERESERAACRRSAAVLQCCRLQSRQTSLATNTAVFTPVQAASETL